MPFYRALTRRHRPLAPPHCSLTPLCHLVTPLLKPSMPFHRPLMTLRRHYCTSVLYTCFVHKICRKNKHLFQTRSYIFQKLCLNRIRIFTTNYIHCYVLFYDMFWQYNQIMHYNLDILNINMTWDTNGVITVLGFGQCDLSCWMVTVTFQRK